MSSTTSLRARAIGRWYSPRRLRGPETGGADGDDRPITVERADGPRAGPFPGASSAVERARGGCQGVAAVRGPHELDDPVAGRPPRLRRSRGGRTFLGRG